MDVFCYAIFATCLLAAWFERKDKMRAIGFVMFGGMALLFGMALTEGMSVRR